MFSHLLGECGTTWFAAPVHARRYRRGFPRSLDSTPLLLPSVDSTFRRALEEWVAGRTNGIRQRFFAISVEREIKHPGVAAICENARKGLFDLKDK
jgi:LysR family transcriptional activator of nhaA